MANGPKNFGAIEFGKGDQDYIGSRFADVREAMFAEPYARNANGELPFDPPSAWDTLRGMPFKPHRFLQGARRTLLSRADLRWGADGKGFTRVVHRCGLGLTGRWEIDEESEFTGYFRKGSHALVVARYSTGGPIRAPGPRAHGFALKLFPTRDPDHVEPLKTANVFLMEDIGGSFTPHVIDAEYVNGPNVSPFNDPKGLPIIIIAGFVFAMGDRMPSERQVYPIAELGEAADAPTRTPRYMRVTADASQARRPDADGRDELLGYIHGATRRQLVFNIDVTNERTTSRFPKVVHSYSGWRRIGRLTFDDAVASYNVDHVLHFAHPVWRDDLNH